tara:strand:+ start:1617 stop:2543 length:927 start_codon:yes stop_codon:yes gene_type:complete
MPHPAIEIKSLSKSYGSTKALNKISITINKGDFYGILGPNGAGKTTLINIITGLVFRDKGSTLVFGKDTVSDFRFTRSKIGLAAQELSVDWFFSIERLLFFQAGYYGIRPKEAKPTIDDLLKRLGLYEKKDSRLRQLSGGMKRRFQLAKALVHNPEIIILDEPTAGVDVELRKDLWKYLRDLHKSGKTILLTTHYIEEAEFLCEKVSIIDNGLVLKEGSPKNLIKTLGKSGIIIKLKSVPEKLVPVINDLGGVINENELIFEVKDPGASLPKVIQKLTDENAEIKSITPNSSSLEEIFLNLTGKKIND